MFSSVLHEEKTTESKHAYTYIYNCYFSQKKFVEHHIRIGKVTSSFDLIPSRSPLSACSALQTTAFFDRPIMPSPSSSGLMSLILMAVSCMADSTLGLQADDLSSSLASESYVPPTVPLAQIEDGDNPEISNPNDQLQQWEQSQISPSCSSYNSNTNTNRRNRKLRLIRRGSAACGWGPHLGSDVLPSWTNDKVPLKVGTYLTGGPLSDRWGVCGTELSVVSKSIPVCTPADLGDITGDAITSLREGLYTDLLMARLCTVPSWLFAI